MNEPLVLDRASNPHALFFGDVSLTKQSFKEQVDINRIVERIARGGQLGDFNSGVPFYADVSDVPDLATYVAIVRDAETKFSALSASLRSRFDNDPVKLVEFLSDPKNSDEARSLGLLEPKVEGSK